MNERKLKILIADDEEGLRLSMAGIMEFEGHDVVTASDGREAIEQVRKGSFDIAFLDIRMPGINGVDTFREVKKLSPETVVVMMTGYAVNELVREALEEGAYACIHKPFDMERIIEIIQNAEHRTSVLVVDNDTVLGKSIANTLNGSGFEVMLATTGSQALDHIKEDCCRIVLVNTELPDYKGSDLYQTIKQLKPGADVIMMSSDSNDVTVVNAALQGSCIFLHKPFKPERVLDIVKKIIRVGQGG